MVILGHWPYHWKIAKNVPSQDLLSRGIVCVLVIKFMKPQRNLRVCDRNGSALF